MLSLNRTHDPAKNAVNVGYCSLMDYDTKCEMWSKECKRRVPDPVSPSFSTSPLIVSSIQA